MFVKWASQTSPDTNYLKMPVSALLISQLINHYYPHWDFLWLILIVELLVQSLTTQTEVFVKIALTWQFIINVIAVVEGISESFTSAKTAMQRIKVPHEMYNYCFENLNKDLPQDKKNSINDLYSMTEMRLSQAKN